MSRTIVVFGALVMVLSVSLVAGAQGQPQPVEFSIQGEVKDVSPTGESFTLWDGTTLTFADTPAFVTDNLRPGAFVTATYRKQGSDNVVTSISIQDPFGRS